MADNNAPIQCPRSHDRCRQTERLVLSLLLLLYLSGSIQPWYWADGKKKRNTPPSHRKEKLGQFPGTRAEPVNEEGGAAVVQSLIGSRPPSCDGRCKGCGRPWMAVQVPVTPQQFRIQWLRATNSLEYSRGDDISNYKPMTWKCRCGEIYFNS